MEREERQKNVTIAEVARAAGVSSATVSYVLSGRTDIKVAEATRERVLSKNAFKGVVVEELEDNTISIELYVILQYGTNISTVANNIIDKVKYTVENITSINVSKIDINVQGIRVK